MSIYKRESRIFFIILHYDFVLIYKKDGFVIIFTSYLDDMKLLFLIIFILYSHDMIGQTEVGVMCFNCENAFDTMHDEGKNDIEYQEGGARHWSVGRLYHKLNGIAKIIAAVDTINPVPLVALCEVENDSVLTRLVNHTPLKSIGYKYVMTDSPDLRGVDVALLYKQEKFMPIDVRRIRPEHEGTPTRDILHVAGIVGVDDTLDVYVVHLPSKLGRKSGEKKSVQVARELKKDLDGVMRARRKPHVIVLGDFNAEFASKQIEGVLNAKKYCKGMVLEKGVLYDILEGKVIPGGVKSYKYRGFWSFIDHILVGGNVAVKDCGVYSSTFILEKDESYGGVKPKRTYVGYNYNGGISDHLPVWAIIEL